MAGLYDDFDEEFDSDGDGDSSQSDALDRVVSEYSDEDIDDEMSEAERKLAKAAYYKVIVKSGVIEDDGTEEAQEINAEARLWARGQMAKLLGLKETAEPAAVAPAQFSEQEALVLKKVAERVLAQGNAASRPEPVVKKVAPPAQPSIKQVTTVKKKPEAKPLRPTRPPARAEQKSPAKKPARPPRDSNGKIDYDNIPTGEVFKDRDGKMYKFIPHPDEDNRRVKINVTQQVQNNAVARIPMPSADAMVQISQMQSMDAVNAIANANPESMRGNNIMVAAAATSLKGE